MHTMHPHQPHVCSSALHVSPCPSPTCILQPPPGLGPPSRRQRAKHDHAPVNPGGRFSHPVGSAPPPRPWGPQASASSLPQLCPITSTLGDPAPRDPISHPLPPHPTVPWGCGCLGNSNPHAVDPGRAHTPQPVSYSNNNSLGGGRKGGEGGRVQGQAESWPHPALSVAHPCGPIWHCHAAWPHGTAP